MPGTTLPLALAQIVFWVAGYYAFAALLPFWRIEPGWSLSALAGGFTLSLLVTAVFSPLAGRWIDAGRALPMTTGCAILAALAMGGLAFVQELWQFYALCALIGIARAGLLYEPCFAILTRHLGAGARAPITRIALVAGFAGTLAFPLVHILSDAQGWRVCVLVLALLVLMPGLPLALIGYRRIERNAPLPAAPPRARVPLTGQFALLALAFGLIAVNHGMIVTHLLPLLDQRGVAAGVATGIAASIGPMQVAGRLAMLAAERRVSTVATLQACLAGLGLAALTLWLAGASTALIVLFALFQGAAYGVTSIARPVLTRERLGQADFGLISGRMGAVFMLGAAIAPLLGAVIAEAAGYGAFLLAAAICVVCGSLALGIAVKKTP